MLSLLTAYIHTKMYLFIKKHTKMYFIDRRALIKERLRTNKIEQKNIVFQMVKQQP